MRDKQLIADKYFDEDILFKHIKHFSYPRLSGTEGEKQAIKEVAETFKEIGFNDDEITTESFIFSDFYSTTLIKFIMMLSLFNMFLFFIFTYFHTILNTVLDLVLISISGILVYFLLKGLKYPEETAFVAKYFGTLIESKNVFTKVPAKKINPNKAGNIIFSAHIDSKSQAYSTTIRVLVYKIWLYAGFFAAIFILIDIITDIEWIKIAARIATLVIMIDNIVLMLLTTGNKSLGALDNACGMTCVFEIARYFREHPLNNFNIWCCQFGAEELGTMGSRNFCKIYEDQFVVGKIFQFNFEMLGIKGVKHKVQMMETYGIPKKNISPTLTKYLKQAAKKVGLYIECFHLATGAHTDTVPFHQRNYDSIDVMTRESARYAHTENDTIDKVDKSISREACLITVQAALLLDKNFKKLS